MSKYITVSGSADVDLDVLPEDILGNVDTADLLKELGKRKETADWADEEIDLRRMVEDYRLNKPIDQHIRTIAHVLYGMVI